LFREGFQIGQYKKDCDLKKGKSDNTEEGDYGDKLFIV